LVLLMVGGCGVDARMVWWYVFVFFLSSHGDHRGLHSFPTRRSSDLPASREHGSAKSPTRRVSSGSLQRRSRCRCGCLRKEWCRRSEEHTSELQSPCNLVCRLLLEKKKTLAQTPPQKYSLPPTSPPLP